MPEAHYNDADEYFHPAIYFLMVHSFCLVINVCTDGDCQLKVENEMQSVLGQYMRRYFVGDHHIIGR